MNQTSKTNLAGPNTRTSRMLPRKPGTTCCRSFVARSPHSPPIHTPNPISARATTQRKEEVKAPHLGSREELVLRGGGGGMAPAAVAVHPLLVPLQREAPQLPQRRLHLHSTPLGPRARPRRIETRIAGVGLALAETLAA